MSTLKVNTIQDASGGNASTTAQIDQGRAKVWCAWNGENTPSIYDSFNVSSVVDNGTGDWTVNFSSNMTDNNYAFTWASGGTIWNGNRSYSTASSLQSLGMGRQDSYSQQDTNIQCIVVFGDQ